jgi:hypothetical protein
MPSSAATALWKSPSSVDRWEQLRSQHADLQRRAGVASGDAAKLERLASLDADFISRDLPQKLLSKEKKLTKDDLVKMVEWKLLRGKWRPALLGYARAQTDAAVAAAAAKALTALGRASSPSDAQTRAALDALCALRGVGPATASIFLCAATGGHVPYMGDEALEACVGTRKYSAEELVALTQGLRKKARELTAAGQKIRGEREWTAEDVQRALHAAELEARVGSGGGVAAAKKKTPTKGKSGSSSSTATATAAPPAKRQRKNNKT